MMIQGQGQSSSGSGSTGRTTSLSFIPALLSSAFFGSGIGLDKGGFLMTGPGDFNRRGDMKGPRSTSLLDPFTNITGSASPSTMGGGSWGDFFGGSQEGLFEALGMPAPSGPQTFGGGGAGAEGGGIDGATGGPLNPFDLVSNLMDLINPGINPAIGGGLQGLEFGELGGLMGNQLLTGDISSTLQEGLQTGFKPDLQPVIDEASRSFFQDIVPQLGQSNVALQEGVGPFSTDLSAQLTGAGQTLASQLGALEVENQNRAGDRRGEMLGLSSLITDQLFNASTDAARNRVDLGEQLAMLGTTGGRQSQLLQLLSGMQPSGPIQASSSQNQSKGGGGGISL